jgi:hypothetical protein
MIATSLYSGRTQFELILFVIVYFKPYDVA